MSTELLNGAVFLPDAPDWNAGVDLTLRWRTEIAVGLTGLEDRVGLRGLPAATMAWRILPKGVAATARLAGRVRQALASGAAAAPCHARASHCAAAAAAALTVAPTPWPWAAGDWLLVRGAGGTAQARQVQGVVGPVLTFSPPLTDLPVDGSPIYPVMFGRLEAERNNYRLHADTWRIGAAEAPASYRGLLVSATIPGEDFLGRIGGQRDAFWLPETTPAMFIKATAAGGFVIEAQGLAEAWAGSADYCLWFAHATLPPMAARVSAVTAGPAAGTERVTLEETLPAPLDASWAVFGLRRVRLDGDTARETTAANGATTLRLATRELPAGSGAGTQAAFLYRFQGRLDPTLRWTLTSHDAPLVDGGETYLPAAISHREPTPGRVTVTAPLDLPTDDAFDVTLRRLELPGGAAETLFTGRAAGRQAEIALAPPVDLDTRGLPAFRVGASCNHRLYGAACGLHAADWATAVTLAGIAGAEITLGADPGRADHWFAGGLLTAGTERRTILASAGRGLLLGEPLRRAQAGDAATLLAGCTHFAAMCGGRFNNLARFGGHPLVAERQPARALTRFAGWQRLGLSALAGAANWTASGGAHRADLAGLACHGPVDAVTHAWVDDQLVWTGEVSRGGAESAELEIPGRGTVTLFWGTPDQAAQADLAALGHPAYQGQCYLWLPQFLIGPDATKLPRIEVALRRAPRVAWLSGAAASVDGDANLAVALAEILLAAGVPDDRFDQAQWLAAALRVAAEDRAASPLLDREMTLAQCAEALGFYLDGRLHWTTEGRLQLVLRRETPGDLTGLPALTGADLIAPPRWDDGATWNRTTVTCLERDRGWTPDEGQWMDGGAFALAGEESSRTMALPWVTRRAVAAAFARRLGRDHAVPRPTGRLQVRRSAAEGIAPGGWLTLDLGGSPGAWQCVTRRGLTAAAVELEVAAGRPAEDERERYASGDVISHDPARPHLT